MSKKDELDLKSQKIHQNWTRNKQQKSQVNGETELTLHNQMLRTAAKSKQL
ncbi:YpzG family protein [Metasolibacillus meyeri]|uniref:YpzG family protein n=1 Tax=Metasolibacillus meyeri TaxID=1071052 RepID=UPI000D31B22D|nr:YpzG family protein [Metasolibacillus meyeri]